MSEPIKVLPMAKLLRLAREKEERERAEKESSTVSGSVDKYKVITTNDAEEQSQKSSETIVKETIPTETIPLQTIVPQTIPQEGIVTESKVNSGEESAHSMAKSQTKLSNRRKHQPSDQTITRQTIVQQPIVDSNKGYYPVFNDISDRLIPELQLDPYQQAVLQRLYRLSRGWKSEECEVGLGTLAKFCVMSRSQVQRSVAKLIEKGLVESLGSSKKGGKEGNRYKVLPGLKTIPRQTIANPTIVSETIVGDTIVREAETSIPENTVVSQGIVPRGINKNSNKELKNTTHTEPGVGVGSKFTIEECRKYAQHLQATGQGINNPGGYATTIHRTGEADLLIESFLRPQAPSPSSNLDTSQCPDCHGSGFYYPKGMEGGVARCKHEQLREDAG
ncbi:MAG TPA: hypothetical protein VF591_26020 [Pyrinomonadaceae bacterium]|jgi:hypothetical protein